MFRRLDSGSHLFCTLQPAQSLGRPPYFEVDIGQRQKRTQSVPFIFGSLHESISRLILTRSLLIFAGFLVQRAQISMTKRYAYDLIGRFIEFHRAQIVNARGIQLATVFKDRAKVRIIYSLPYCTIELLLSL